MCMRAWYMHIYLHWERGSDPKSESLISIIRRQQERGDVSLPLLSSVSSTPPLLVLSLSLSTSCVCIYLSACNMHQRWYGTYRSEYFLSLPREDARDIEREKGREIARLNTRTSVYLYTFCVIGIGMTLCAQVHAHVYMYIHTRVSLSLTRALFSLLPSGAFTIVREHSVRVVVIPRVRSLLRT